MAWEHAYTTDYRDLLLRLKEVVTGFPIITMPIRSGNGDGIVHGIHAVNSATAQTWTLTCTNDLPPATFSVVGSASGAQSSLTVDAAYSNAQFSCYITAGSVPFSVGDSFVFTVVVNPLVAATQTWEVKHWLGTGAKVVNYLASTIFGGSSFYAADNAIDQQDGTAWRSDPELGNDSWWQVEFDKPVDLRRLTIKEPDGAYLLMCPKEFEVLYSDNGTSFTQDSAFTGQTAWQTGELRSFTLSGSAGAHKFWRIHITLVDSGTSARLNSIALYDANNKYNVGFYGDGYDTILRGPGTAGGDNIYVSIRTDAAEIHGPNWIIDGSVGYSAGLDSLNQPTNTTDGFISASIPYPDKNRLTLFDGPFKYWFAISGRVIRVAARFQNIVEFGYLGFYLPYSLPSQYPYPLIIAGSQSAGGPITWQYHWSRTDEAHSLVFNPGSPQFSFQTIDTVPSPARVYTPYNSWKQVANFHGTSRAGTESVCVSASPYLPRDNSTEVENAVGQNSDGKWPMSAIVLFDRQFDAQYGELDGVKYLPGIHAIESIINHESEQWVVLNHVFREQENQFFAVRLA